MDEEQRLVQVSDRVDGLCLESGLFHDFPGIVETDLVSRLDFREMGALFRDERVVLPFNVHDKVDDRFQEVTLHGAGVIFVGIVIELLLIDLLSTVEDGQGSRRDVSVDEGHGHLEAVREGGPFIGSAAPVLQHEDDRRILPQSRDDTRPDSLLSDVGSGEDRGGIDLLLFVPVTFFADDGDAVREEYRHEHYKFIGLRESGRHAPGTWSGELTLAGTVPGGCRQQI